MFQKFSASYVYLSTLLPSFDEVKKHQRCARPDCYPPHQALGVHGSLDRLRCALHSVIEFVVLIPTLVPWPTLVNKPQVGTHTNHIFGVVIQSGSVYLASCQYGLRSLEVRICALYMACVILHPQLRRQSPATVAKMSPNILEGHQQAILLTACFD
jgi:hypothetical protein